MCELLAALQSGPALAQPPADFLTRQRRPLQAQPQRKDAMLAGRQKCDPLRCLVAGGKQVVTGWQLGRHVNAKRPLGGCAVCGDIRTREERSGLHQVIAGGESGTAARPCELEWVRRIVRQCRAAGVAVFVKQLGSRASDPVNGIAGKTLHVAEEARDLVSLRLRDAKGGDMAEWPAELRRARDAGPGPTE